MSPRRIYKLALVCAAIIFFALAGVLHQALNRQRTHPDIGLTRVTDLGSNAPPVLAFTTVALGGFRGLIANVLWIRANELQNDGKYFEMVQLADWITKLEPTFTQVWLVQGWNMAYNISVKFSDFGDRWRWVQSGIELLRDQGLRYNPRDALMYRELGWFFQHKMGQNMDDAHLYYKAAWAREMTTLFGGVRPNFDELLNPQTPAARQRAALLRDKYKMEPAIMKEVDQLYGPLEWRLPETHAIYWATVGLRSSKKKDQVMLRRMVYQSMLQSVLRGRILYVQPDGGLVFGPDLDRVPLAYENYERLREIDPEMTFVIDRAQKGFLKEIVYEFYSYNRLADANRYFKLLQEKFPDAVPPNVTMEEFALKRLNDNVAEMPSDRMKLLIDGIISQHFFSLAIDADARAQGFDLMAQKLYGYYAARIQRRQNPLAFPPYPEMKRLVLEDMLDPERSPLPPELMARLRTRLNFAPRQAASQPKG
jgi:hypothetical protein